MSEFDYDLFVIGGGSGGVRAARIAAGHGAKVAIAEEYRFGGTCVIRGCVPKKLLVYASRFRDEFEDAAGFGWTRRAAELRLADPDRQQGRGDRPARGPLPARPGARRRDHPAGARASWPTRTRSSCSPATARSPRAPSWSPPADARWCREVPGAGHAITSNEAFHLESLPKSILIVGGGYIAVEFAGIFNGLGVETTLLYRGHKILRGFDEELRDHLTEELFKRGIDVVCNADDRRHREEPDAPHRHARRTAARSRPTKVMFAIGPLAQHRGLGLEAAGVTLGENGEIVVDEFSRSSVENIYAVGDVTDRVNLTPVAIREGHAFADTVFGGKPTAVDHELVPTAVFSTPEIGTVGLPEAHGARALPQARRLQGALPAAQAHAVGARRAHVHEAAGRRRERQAWSAAMCWAPTPPRSCRWRPSPCGSAPPRPTSTPPWRCIRARRRSSSPCARSGCRPSRPLAGQAGRQTKRG